MNGFELAGRPMKVGNVTERTNSSSSENSQAAAAAAAAGGNAANTGLDREELDKSGIDLGATGRLALMAKLAEGTGMKLPQAANAALNNAAPAPGQGRKQEE